MDVYNEARTMDAIAAVMRSCVSRGVCKSDALEEARAVMGQMDEDSFYVVASATYDGVIVRHLESLGVSLSIWSLLGQGGVDDGVSDGVTCSSRDVREWVANIKGSFTLAEMDRELLSCAPTRQYKKNTRKALNALVKEGILRKDSAKANVYHKVNTEIDWVDRSKAKGEEFTLSLPLGLSDLVVLHPKSLAIFAGAFNAGKTALLLNVALDNCATHPTVYLMSEMGNDEFVARTNLFTGREADWECVRAAHRPYDQGTVIQRENPDGLTIVDFIEERDGEYFNMGTHIREIYNSIGQGCVIAAIQKQRGAEMGRGGDATAEKARLYCTVDCILEAPDRTICAMKIIKAKSYKGENPNGKTCLFAVIGGWRIVQETPWQYINAQQMKSFVELFRKRYGEKQKQPLTFDAVPF